ncbi:Tat pathway signal sequence domain protein [Asticcacaulis sp. ZE23SCel15]|uniref:exo-rhamnogalacturonan lyase family protein n=1 Tax=Asticcacaulis sp. ZE23SCel15 TaxID=3059027 RepID=UPI00265E2326|nr:Tat pathway signal sequence domain protein [Asticcacaulis sp. ZE23SCel15]WKL57944.1 Tat pathway signal sequence domain protein [Asticcacaulis sp. ZE23SCel15]
MSSQFISRRHMLQSAAAFGAVAFAAGNAMSASAATGQVSGKGKPVSSTPLSWMDKVAPNRFDGTALGVPWPRGTVKAAQALKLTGADGQEVASQSWPLAYWPDGSLKWSAHAVAGSEGLAGASVVMGKPKVPANAVRVTQTPALITVKSGDLTWQVPTSGEALIASATKAGRTTLRDMKLVARSQDQADLEATGSITQSQFTSKVTKVTVEQTGPVRAVLKVEGTHSGQAGGGGGRDWLPFSVRLYFYAGTQSVRIVHSFIYDGDPAKDFIRGLGVTAKVAMSDETYNRHIRLSGEGVGVWGEAVKPLTGLRRQAGKKAQAAQIAGEAVKIEDIAKPVQDGLKWIPEWGDFSLSQLTPDGFTLKKRTEKGHAWINSNAGTRTKGLGYVGGAAGGVALGFKDFWQRSPTAIDIRNAHTDLAEITAWLWSPDAPAMDVRPYRSAGEMDTHPEEIEGLNITYEDYEKGWDTAHGVARTSELNLWVLNTTPSHEVFSGMAERVANPPRLMASPERIHAAGVFGDWDVVNATTPARKILEDRLTYQIDYYMQQVEAHRWYGFWTYGDVMHTYDADRHMWRYDIGGYAWDNSELSTDLWIWYTFLRTGRADVFKFGEAMTRQTGEVDVYHLGRFKGFGTRHGVQPWSDSSKQPRVSNAAYRRIYYFLTADERVGDLMRDLNESDFSLKNVDISRKLPPSAERATPEGVVNSSFGTSWGSFISAWLTEWERTGDTKWRDRIINGMVTIGGLKRRWFASSAPYDLKTGKFLGDGDYIAISHLNGVFGVVEMSSELLSLIDEPLYRKAWLEYCRYYNAPNDELQALLGTVPRGRNLRDSHSRLTAYAAYHENDKALAMRAWSEFFGNEGRESDGGLGRRTTRIDGVKTLRPLDEDNSLSTNGTAQWGLAAIQNMALIGDSLEEAAALAGVVK